MQHSSNFIPYEHPLPFTQEQSYKNVLNFYHFMETRRSLRAFSDRPVDLQTIELIIKTAATAPSGAHKQPWTFCAVQNPNKKKQIREAAEKEEYESYHGRMSEEWLNDLKPFENVRWHFYIRRLTWAREKLIAFGLEFQTAFYDGYNAHEM